MAEKRCYTVAELQQILGVSRPSVYNLLKRNEFRWVQMDGGKYRISKKSFDNWLDKRPGETTSGSILIEVTEKPGVMGRMIKQQEFELWMNLKRRNESLWHR